MQEVVRDYEASLKKLFRRASAQSKHVIAVIKKYLAPFAPKTDLPLLKALVRYHLGMTSQGVAEFGERLKHDSTLWKILHNKLAKKNITM